MDKNRKMTQHEKQIMRMLWNSEKQKATISELLEMFPEPKPAYTTLATFLRIMTQKGFVKYEKHKGMKNFVFYPSISKREYLKFETNEMKNTFHSNRLFHFLWKTKISVMTNYKRLSN